MSAASWIVALLSMAAAGTACCAEPLQISTGDDYAPYTGRQLPEGGLVTEIVARVFDQMHQDYRLVWVPWTRALEGVRTGAYAASFPYIHAPDRDEAFFFSVPLAYTRANLYFRAGAGLSGADLSTLIGKRGCLPIGWAPLQQIQALVDQGEIALERPLDISACARLVQAGRDDFLVMPEGEVPEAPMPRPALVTDGVAIVVRPLHLVVSRSAPDGAGLIARFDTAFHILKANGEIDRIIARHTHG